MATGATALTAAQRRELEAFERAGDLIADGGLVGLEPGPEHFPPAVCLLTADSVSPLCYLAKGILLENTIGLLVGADGEYKTTVLLAIAVAVAGGLPVFGVYDTGHPRTVLIVSEEDERAVIQNRVAALIEGNGWVEHRDTILAHLHVHALDGFLIDDPTAQGFLLREQADLGVELMLFDPLADMTSGDESSARDARPVKHFWRQLLSRGCTVLVAHHFGKPREGVASRDRVRGSSAWLSASRTAYLVRKVEDGVELECLKMSRTARPDTIAIDLVVQTAPDNAALWSAASLRARQGAGNWTVEHRRQLRQSERTALAALEGFREEAVSWSRWKDVSGLTGSTLGEARIRLLDLGYVQKIEAGITRFKKPDYRYTITGEGVAALLPDAETPRVRPGSTPDSNGGSPLRLRDSTTPLRGVGPDRGMADGPDSNDLHRASSGSEAGPGTEAVSDEYFASLAGEAVA